MKKLTVKTLRTLLPLIAAIGLGLVLYEPIKILIPVEIKRVIKGPFASQPGPLEEMVTAVEEEVATAVEEEVAPEVEPEITENKFWRRGSADDAFWANEVLRGGYILHFRHAHRDMDNQLFGDTVVFDALDVIEGFKGEESPWAANICLNVAGERQAKAARVIFDIVELPVSTVISSPNCRAEQTARLAFGRVDQVSESLLIRLMYNADGREQLDRMFIDLISEAQINLEAENGNVILVGHNGTIGYLGATFPQNLTIQPEDGREEMGFTVMSLSEGGELIFHHEFSRLRHFVLATLPLSIGEE